MRQDSYIININNPCSESWNEMVPANGGRFCAHCSKTVIDFSKLSDDEIVKIISQNKGKICGRFLETQLNKEIITTQQTHANRSFYKYLASILLLGISKNAFSFNNNKINFSKENIVANPTQHKVENIATDTLVNEIKGRVLDSATHKPLQFVSIKIKGVRNYVNTDSIGNYTFKIPNEFIHQDFILQALSVGYNTQEIYINKNAINKDYNFYLSTLNVEMGDVVIIKRPKHKKHWWQFRK